MSQKKEMDRVCGMWIDMQGAQFISEYKGKKFFFCEAESKRKFDENPEYYMNAFDGREN